MTHELKLGDVVLNELILPSGKRLVFVYLLFMELAATAEWRCLLLDTNLSGAPMGLLCSRTSDSLRLGSRLS